MSRVLVLACRFGNMCIVSIPIRVPNVIVLKTYSEDYPESKRRANTGQKALYQALDIVPAIITKKQFQNVATEKERRSNIVKTEEERARKTTHYSMSIPE